MKKCFLIILLIIIFLANACKQDDEDDFIIPPVLSTIEITTTWNSGTISYGNTRTADAYQGTGKSYIPAFQ